MSQSASLPDKSEQIDEQVNRAVERDKQVITSPHDSSESLPLDGSRWQNIIWREWRVCEDEEYAQHLFELVAHETIGWWSVTSLTLLGAFYGALAGLLVLLISPALAGINPAVFAGVGGLLGAITALLSGGWLSWQKWLAWLTPASFSKMGRAGWLDNEFWAGMMVGLAGLSIVVGWFLGGFVALLSGGKNVGIEREHIVKAFLGALIGLGGALAGRWVTLGGNLGAGLGLILGAWAGEVWGGGLVGVVVGGITLLLSGLVFGLSDGITGWLGLSLGYGLGATLRVLAHRSDWANLYSHRFWYFWWRGQPSLAKVEGALQHLLEKIQPETWPVWREVLRYLKEHKRQPGQPDQLIKALQSTEWASRFAARHLLVALGGEAVEPLRRLAADPNPLQQMALWLLSQIEQETTNRLGWRSADLLCPHCLARFAARSVELAWGVSYTYYGCRLCGQSREFISWLKVVAVLDANSTEWFQRQEEQFRLNWLVRRSLFDFDWVEIIQASDEDVERFAVQVGNDTDPYRKARYQRMTCWVRPECRLAENTRRILEKMFGKVTAHAPHL